MWLASYVATEQEFVYIWLRVKQTTQAKQKATVTEEITGSNHYPVDILVWANTDSQQYLGRSVLNKNPHSLSYVASYLVDAPPVRNHTNISISILKIENDLNFLLRVTLHKCTCDEPI